MNVRTFDALACSLSTARSRRRLLAVLAVIPLLGGLPKTHVPDAAASRKRRRRRRRKQKQPCTPRTTAQICGGKCGAVDDGCGESVNCGNCANPTPICQDHVCVACERRDQCASDEICYEGRCQACDVTCQAGTCSNADLLAAIGSAAFGGTVYICPGRYTGVIVPAKDVSLVGAGSGEAATAETVLDAAGAGRVIDIPQDLTVGLHQLRITGGYIQDTQGARGFDMLVDS